jgi:hypothetical protein
VNIFLSYPSAERTLADRLRLALEAEGHEVFFDRSDLDPGQSFHERLRKAIHSADAMIFLITPASVAAGSYTLTELGIAEEQWRRPAGHVLPVMVAPTPIAALPPYLSAVTVLQPLGELVAETVAAVSGLRGGGGAMRRIVIGVAIAVVAIAAGGLLATQIAQRRAEAAATAHDVAAATEAMKVCNDGSHDPALQRLGELASRQPMNAAIAALREDCAMRWTREMRATSSSSGQLTFDEQVAKVQPVLLQGLSTATGMRSADLRAHVGWTEHLRRREGKGSGDPVPHWQRALADDATNVYAHAMWGNVLMPGRLAEARQHFEKAVASGRDREFVRRLQFGAALGGGDEATDYAVVVANEMRRAGEAMTTEQRRRLRMYAFNSRVLDEDTRKSFFSALPPADLLATLQWLLSAGELMEKTNYFGRFCLAAVQANAGESEAAAAGFSSLEQDLRATRQGGQLLQETQKALGALRKPRGG